MHEADFRKRIQAIRVVITDVDGVLTDGGMYYAENGDEVKKFNVRDGAGVVLLKLAGVKVGAVTGETTELVRRRMKKIGVDFLATGVRDKFAYLEEYLGQQSYSPAQAAYIGDEINDYGLLGNVGLFFAVADACPEIRARADHVLESKGGEGALREVASIILLSQGKAEEARKAYLRQSTNDVT